MDDSGGGEAPSRFAAVKKKAGATAASFCEKSYGAKERKYVPPILRAFDDEKGGGGGWTWVNVWATWCGPCVEEIPMLTKWRDALSRDGVRVSFEMLSVDEPQAKEALDAWKTKTRPGPIRWLRSTEDSAPYFEALGIDKQTSIPIHVLVDPQGDLRCVRVGAIHEQDYGAARELLSQ